MFIILCVLIIEFGLVGCWIIYKVNNKMQELVAYELMSANDAPERDPMDWYAFLKHNAMVYLFLQCYFNFISFNKELKNVEVLK